MAKFDVTLPLKKTVLGKYTDTMKADRFYIDMSKDADKIQVGIYDFENTGVIIEKKCN